MSTVRELRESIMSANAYGKGVYFEPGRYLVKTDKVFYKRTLIEGTAKESIVAEFRVIESSREDCEPGCTRGVIYAFHLKGWLSRFKSLALAIIGQDPDGQIPREAQEAVADIYAALRDDDERRRLKLPPNFLEGKRLRVEAFPGKSQGGTDITELRWAPVKEDEGEIPF